VTAFVAAFNTCAISRLKWTMQQLSRKMIETKAALERCVSSSSSYKDYRMLLERAASIPCIPFLAVHLSDLVFIEEGNSDTINGYLVNFTKRKQIYEVCRSFHTHARTYVRCEHVALS
jgi:son of sevenless